MDDDLCESPPRRISLRTRGQRPPSPPNSNKDSPVKELKILERTGGREGKLYNDTTKWQLFPDDCSEYCSYKEVEIAFTSIKNIIELPLEYSNNENRLQDDCAYQLSQQKICM